jgi:Xaa-Pro aminopeptidase
MKSDLDLILKEENIDALWVMGAMKNNADMVYFTGAQEVKNADLFKLTGKPPVVYHTTAMEREEAAKSGLETHAFDTEVPLGGYLKNHAGDLTLAMAERYKDVLIKIGLSKGRVAVSGTAPLSTAFSILEILKTMMPEIEFTGILKDSAIQKARMTKDPDEAERVRKMGKITTNVVGKVADFLTSQKDKNNLLVGENSEPVTIEKVKSLINLWLAEHGAENPEGTIFSIGRDAGIPHNTGNPNDLIELGKPIVFDIFPSEKGGGYFYDFTRTWCLGYAPDEVQKLYNQVAAVFHQIIGSLKVGKHFKFFQEKTCQLFSELGHTTIADKPDITEGYVHSIGHGLGLEIHENPFSGITSAENDILKTGVVFTVEPGLYYPSKGMGVRIEDTVYLNPEGQFEIMADFPYDLVLPMKNK